MRLRFRHFRTVAEMVGAALLLFSGAAVAIAATAAPSRPSSTPSGLKGGTLHGCANLKTGAVSLVLKSGGRCPRGTAAVSWNSALLGSKTNRATVGANGATCTLGQVILTAGKTAAAGTLPANGQLLKISQFTPLFSLLSTEYGGNGTTTFALHNLRNAAPNGLTYSICATAGVFP
jgi:hypothetical protein